MSLLDASLYFTAALIAGALLEPLASRYRLPLNLMLMIAGFLASEALVHLGIDTGLRWYNFHDLVFYLLIPFLIFDTASRLNRAALLREWRVIALMAGPVLLAGAGLTAVLIYYAVGHPAGFPLSAALLAAALLVGTDPGEVIAISGVDLRYQRSTVLLEGESVISDVLAVTLFAVFLDDALMGVKHIDFLTAGRIFLWSAAGGIAVGLIAGGLGWIVVRVVAAGTARALAAASIAFGAFIVCQYFVEGSGAIAVLIATLMTISHPGWGNETERATVHVLGWSARVVLFVIAGATVTTFMFRDHWLAMLIAVAAASLARVVAVNSGLSGMNILSRGDEFSLGERSQITVGGVKGAIVLGLALSLPLEFEAWYTVQSMVYGVVIFTLVAHPLIARALIRRIP